MSATSSGGGGGDAGDGGNGSDSAEPVILCDGTTNIRFRYELGGGAPGTEGQIVMSENGNRVLVIDGTCHYWTYGSDWASLGVHRGNLTEAQEAQLIADLHLGSWQEWAGSWNTALCDGPTQLFEFADSKITLSGGCGPSETTPPFDATALAQAFNDDFDSLKAAGPEVDGGVHIVVYAYDSGQPAYSPPAWPLALDPHSIALTREAAGNLQRGQSTLLPSPDDGAKLRAFRGTFLAGTYGGQWYGQELSAVGTDGTKYGIWFRDVMPGEDANGLIQLF